MRAFFPIGEGSQADYESLRSAVLAGAPLLGPLTARFERGGLPALIGAPSAQSMTCFAVELMGATRPAWSPYADPRVEALAESYGLLLSSPAVPLRPMSKEA